MVVKNGDNTADYENIKREIAHSEKKRKLSRLNFNISLFMQGKLEILNSDEFVFDLTYYISDQKSDQEKKDELLKKLGQSALSDDSNLKERSLMVLSLAAEKFLSEDNKNCIILITELLTQWLNFEKEIISGHSVILTGIGDLTIWLMANECWENAENVMTVISKIQSEELKKDRVVKVLTTSVQIKLADHQIVEKLTEQYLKGDDNQTTYKNLLVSLGTGAVSYLLQRATSSQNHKERLSLTDLILCFGEVAASALVEFLQKRPADAIIRFILHMMAELKEDFLYEHVRQYLTHEDINIQHETVRCIFRFEGKNLQERLLAALEQVDDSLKSKIIRHLAEVESERESVAAILYKIGEEKINLTEPTDADLLKTLSAALKLYPFSESIELLQTMQTKFKDIPGQSELLFQINESLRVLHPQVRHNLRRIDDAGKNISFDNDPVEAQIALKKVRKIEEEIKYALGAGDREAAGQILYRESIAAAGEKDFQTAELLRDRMLEIDPMALSDVLLLSEAIEEEKETLQPSHSLQIWNDLNKQMSNEERDIFYDGLRQARYIKGSIIARKGEIDTSLYFINSGYVGLSCGSGANETFLKKMQPGDILGAEQFFSVSVWTVTLKALTEVHIQVLDRAALKKIRVNFSGIEDLLRRYSSQYAQIPGLLEMSGDDRRIFPRYSGDLVIKNMLLDQYGQKGDHYFKGRLIDISQGGLAFNVKIPSRKHSRLLLGRQIITTIPLGNMKCIRGIGAIVGVKNRDIGEHDFSLHVQLLKKIDQGTIKKIFLSSDAGRKTIHS